MECAENKGQEFSSRATFKVMFFAPIFLFALQQPTYPEGAGVRKSLTVSEIAWLATQPKSGPLRATAPPFGPVHCTAEYEPQEGILMAWEGTNGQNLILAQMAAEITTVGNAKVWCVVDNQSEAASASSSIAAQGADMSRVETVVVQTDSIWIRDYGPRYIYEGEVRSIIDHKYNRPRNKDNAFNRFFNEHRGQARYNHGLTHGGGNFHLSALEDGYLTELILNENGSHTASEIQSLFLDFQNLVITLLDPFPTSVDSTQHLDMWMQIVSDDKVIISDWPAQSGSTQDQICDATATMMAAKGYQVFRIPARKTSGWNGAHYTYTNAVMCNDLVLIPEYSDSAVSSYNSQAFSTWQAACPNKTIIPINSDAVVSYAGVLHCITSHVPAHLGGNRPTAYLVAPNEGSFAAGDTIDIQWLSDDRGLVQFADVEISADGGTTWNSIAQNLPAASSHSWTVPNQLNSSQGLIRILVQNDLGENGSDASDQLLTFGSGSGNQAALIPYGVGKPGSQGVPALTASANPVLGTSLQLELSQALPQGQGWFLYGTATDTLPFDGATVLVQYTKTYPFQTDGNGIASLLGQVPNQSNLAGFSIYWQAWIQNDPMASGQGWSCSNGLEMRLGY